MTSRAIGIGNSTAIIDLAYPVQKGKAAVSYFAQELLVQPLLLIMLL
ncbi:MAG: hypothetical protein IT342_03235 [Candidatus Melainabacteria bacterium]|nr:hypothetical protein [Candidatus Melainabacteria bacterium]